MKQTPSDGLHIIRSEIIQVEGSDHLSVLTKLPLILTVTVIGADNAGIRKPN